MKRILTVLAVVAGLIAVGSPAFGYSSSDTKPTLNATQANFTPTSPGTYTMRLWTLPSPSTLVGSTTGSGTLTLSVPQTATCEFQVDVRTGANTFYSGLIATVPGCGQNGMGQRYTMGYWKNHESATEALLPQSLGHFVVSDFPTAHDVFTHQACSDAVQCLAAHLLTAELDMAGGSSQCIVGVIFQANQLLDKVNYLGPPGPYTLTPNQQAQALMLEVELDTYTNDSTSTSC